MSATLGLGLGSVKGCNAVTGHHQYLPKGTHTLAGMLRRCRSASQALAEPPPQVQQPWQRRSAQQLARSLNIGTW